jgi:phage-related tail fiber protein
MTKSRDLADSVNANKIPGSRIEDGTVTAGKLSAGAAVPTGAVFYFASSSAPSGYLKANGDTVPNGSGTVQGVTANYAALYAVLGSTYGSAGKLPDLRGEFVRGWDDSRGIDTSRSFGSGQTDELKSHNHSITPSTLVGRSGAFSATGGSQPLSEETVTIGNTGGTETRPRNVALLACIKY